jgi:hypothetical protein
MRTQRFVAVEWDEDGRLQIRSNVHACRRAYSLRISLWPLRSWPAPIPATAAGPLLLHSSCSQVCEHKGRHGQAWAGAVQPAVSQKECGCAVMTPRCLGRSQGVSSRGRGEPRAPRRMPRIPHTKSKLA